MDLFDLAMQWLDNPSDDLEPSQRKEAEAFRDLLKSMWMHPTGEVRPVNPFASWDPLTAEIDDPSGGLLTRLADEARDMLAERSSEDVETYVRASYNHTCGVIAKRSFLLKALVDGADDLEQAQENYRRAGIELPALSYEDGPAFCAMLVATAIIAPIAMLIEQYLDAGDDDDANAWEPGLLTTNLSWPQRFAAHCLAMIGSLQCLVSEDPVESRQETTHRHAATLYLQLYHQLFLAQDAMRATAESSTEEAAALLFERAKGVHALRGKQGAQHRSKRYQPLREQVVRRAREAYSNRSARDAARRIFQEFRTDGCLDAEGRRVQLNEFGHPFLMTDDPTIRFAHWIRDDQKPNR